MQIELLEYSRYRRRLLVLKVQILTDYGSLCLPDGGNWKAVLWIRIGIPGSGFSGIQEGKNDTEKK